MARALGLGSAKEGTGHWWTQRVTAVGVLLLGAWFLLSLQFLPGLGHEAVVAWLARPWNAVLMLLLIGTVTAHSELGVRVVIEDYVHQPFVRTASLVLQRFAHVLVATAAAFSVLRIAFGAAT
jgi:succinate dehydrogenase / fumarate reductase membrane anchor subunit